MLQNRCYKLYLLALIFLPVYAKGQGCSDAGFCTMGAMKPDQPFNKKVELRLRSMEVSFYRGTTTLTPIIYVATADMNFSLNNKTSFQLKVPYQAARGALGNTSGMGDISLCVTRNVYSTEKFDINLSFGSKIPTNKSDKSVSSDGTEYPLPMYYQTSLGTFDAIAGASVINRDWLFATGIQIPLNQNDNQFIWTRWTTNPHDINYVQRYANALELKRGTDVMLRVERNFRFSRFNFTMGLLPIYRVTKDQIKDPTTGEHVKVDGTTGVALSGILTAGYSFNVNSGVKLVVGRRILHRDTNPDGLTREFVSSVSYFYRF